MSEQSPEQLRFPFGPEGFKQIVTTILDVADIPTLTVNGVSIRSYHAKYRGHIMQVEAVAGSLPEDSAYYFKILKQKDAVGNHKVFMAEKYAYYDGITPPLLLEKTQEIYERDSISGKWHKLHGIVDATDEHGKFDIQKMFNFALLSAAHEEFIEYTHERQRMLEDFLLVVENKYQDT